MKTTCTFLQVGQTTAKPMRRLGLPLIFALGWTGWCGAAESPPAVPTTTAEPTPQAAPASPAAPPPRSVTPPEVESAKGAEPAERRAAATRPAAATDRSGAADARRLLEEEIQLLESELEQTRKLVDSGHATQSSLLGLQRELLSLRLQLTRAAGAQGSRREGDLQAEQLKQEEALLTQQLKLVDEELVTAQRRVEAGTSPKSALLPFQRERLRLKRELAALTEETAAAPASRRRDSPPATSRALAGLDARLAAGVVEEEADLDLDAAIASYRALISQFDSQRALVATALFRLGECLRKQGRLDEARGHYARILREFPEQTHVAQLCQKRLPARSAYPGATTTAAADAPAVLERQLAQAKAEAAQLEARLKDSHDQRDPRATQLDKEAVAAPDGRDSSAADWLSLQQAEREFKRAEANFTARSTGRGDYDRVKRSVALDDARAAFVKQVPPAETRIFALRHAQATDVAASLQPLLPSECRLVADSRINALIASGTKDKLDALARLLEKADSAVAPAAVGGSETRAQLEWQLAQAHKEEILARRELANSEVRYVNREEQIRTSPASEQAKADLLQARHDLEAAKGQLDLWSKEIARLEARLRDSGGAEAKPSPKPDPTQPRR